MRRMPPDGGFASNSANPTTITARFEPYLHHSLNPRSFVGGALPKKPANARAETKSSPHRGRRPRGHLSKCTVVRSEIEFINPTAKALSLGCRKFVVKERKVIAHEFASTERYEFATGVLAARSARCHRLASSAE